MPSPYAYDLEEADIKRERGKARDLRHSQWWKRRLAKGACHYCGRKTPPAELTMDHIVPIARGVFKPMKIVTTFNYLWIAWFTVIQYSGSLFDCVSNPGSATSAMSCYENRSILYMKW